MRSLAEIRRKQVAILESASPQDLRALGVEGAVRDILPNKPLVSREQIEDAILKAPLDGFDLADIVAAIQAKALLRNPRFAFRFDIEPFRNALAELEDEDA